MSRTCWLGVFILLGLMLGGVYWFWPQANRSGSIVDDASPVSDVVVRWQGTQTCTRSDHNGHFSLPPSPHKDQLVTAAKEGYRIGVLTLGQSRLVLEKLPGTDNEDYQWVDPHPDPTRPHNCGNCHATIFKEWNESAHARSVINPRVLRLFAGTDGKSPGRADWNVLTENQFGAGVCAKCHAPTLQSSDLTYDLRQAEGVALRGVHCDYCHKVVAAPTDKLGIRFGRDGLTLLRPAQDDQLFFGSLDDAVRPGESFAYSPLYKQSSYCASCHEGILFGVHVYGTYSEWLESPAKTQGQHCQDCHMTPTGHMTNIAPGKGGIERDPQTLASHGFPGSTEEMLKRCLQCKTQVRILPDGGPEVRVELRADQVGHRVPTGFIDRHLVLAVDAEGEHGEIIELRDGPRLPEAVGQTLADKPGFLFAKILTDDAGRSPLPFWLPPARITDTRLFPGQPDTRRFVFGGKAVHFRVRLWYRRLWHVVAPEPDNEILLVDRRLSRP